MTKHRPGYAVYTFDDQSTDPIRIGSAWAHRDGKGYDIRFNTLPRSNRLTIKSLPKAAKPPAPRGQILHGDCTKLMRALADNSIDFILTDPPYLVRYRDRQGRTVANDDNDAWMMPAYREMYRVLREGSLAVSFYGWGDVDKFMAAWKAAGFRIVGHLVFAKPYASSRNFLAHTHEQAYLLAKGHPMRPTTHLKDILPWGYTGNKLHPTQKPVEPLEQLVKAFSKPGDLVLDPFCGSGSTLVAAQQSGRAFLGMDLDDTHHRTASKRLNLLTS